MELNEIKTRLDALFPRLNLGEIERSEIEDDFLYFDVDGYPFVVGVETDTAESLIGPLERPLITLAIMVHHPGRFNPYNGGTPPEDEDVSLGRFYTLYECVRKMVDAIMAEKLTGLCEIVEEELSLHDEIDESMDGDFDSGMASAGFGTDEDYGYYGDE